MVCANSTSTSYVEIVQSNTSAYPVVYTTIGTYPINLNSSNNIIASFPFKVFNRFGPSSLDAGTIVLKFSTAATRKDATCGSPNLIIPATPDSRNLQVMKKCGVIEPGEITLFLDIYPNPALVDSANKVPYMHWRNYAFGEIRDLPPLSFRLSEFATMISRVWYGVGLWNSYLDVMERWMDRALALPVDPNSAFGQILALSAGQNRFINYNWPITTAQGYSGGFNFSAPIPVSASNLLNQPLSTDWYLINNVAGLPALTLDGGIPIYPRTAGFGNAVFPNAPTFAGQNVAVTPGELLNGYQICPQVGTVRSGSDFAFGLPKSTQLIPGRKKQFILNCNYTPNSLMWTSNMTSAVFITVYTQTCV